MWFQATYWDLNLQDIKRGSIVVDDSAMTDLDVDLNLIPEGKAYLNITSVDIFAQFSHEFLDTSPQNSCP